MAIDRNGLPGWCGRADLLELWEAARKSRQDILPRLIICDLLDGMWAAREAGREATALAECLRLSIAESQPGLGGDALAPAGAYREDQPRVEPAIHSMGAIPAIWGALGGWPLAGRFNHADRVARLWLMSALSHRLAPDTWMEMVQVPHPSFPFLVSKLPVTHAQWEAVWGGRLLDPMPDRPKIVPIDRAREFCRRFTMLTSLGTWLPTESQWESAVDGWDANPGSAGPGASLAARLRAGGPNNLGLCSGRQAVWECCQAPGPRGDGPWAAGRDTGTIGAGEVERRLGDTRRRSPTSGGSTQLGFRIVQLASRDGTWNVWDFEAGLI